MPAWRRHRRGEASEEPPLRIQSTAENCVIHVSHLNSHRIRIAKVAPGGVKTVNLNLHDARAVADAIHDVLEGES